MFPRQMIHAFFTREVGCTSWTWKGNRLGRGKGIVHAKRCILLRAWRHRTARWPSDEHQRQRNALCVGINMQCRVSSPKVVCIVSIYRRRSNLSLPFCLKLNKPCL